MTIPRLFVDADVLFAGAAASSVHGASLMILRMAEITLIEALVSDQVITEAKRNLAAKIPDALPAFELLVSRSLSIVPDPESNDLEPYIGLADPKDLPILVTAIREQCPWLVTFNVRDFHPGHPQVKVLRPGEFIWVVRDLLTWLSADE